ncbi:MAG: hypothetical protein NT005_04395 [Spirochaetes bacterium]|nr:hypothetical protein [Spirochaetota bacterium]
MSDIVPRGTLTKQAMMGIGAAGGGIALLALVGHGLFSIIAGGILAVAGLALSGGKSDRTAGVVTAAVGIATLVTGIFPGLAPLRWLMTAGGIVLLGTGVVLLFRFFKDLKKRS